LNIEPPAKAALFVSRIVLKAAFSEVQPDAKKLEKSLLVYPQDFFLTAKVAIEKP
jgi:hypothetical protein